jgi:hypothetical protein
MPCFTSWSGAMSRPGSKPVTVVWNTERGLRTRIPVRGSVDRSFRSPGASPSLFSLCPRLSLGPRGLVFRYDKRARRDAVRQYVPGWRDDNQLLASALRSVPKGLQ